MRIEFNGVGFPFSERMFIPQKSVGCRAIIEQDDCILFSCLTKRSQFLLPGGRMDNGESPIECIERECLEELGMIVHTNSWLCSIEEQYEKIVVRNDYFIVDVREQGLPLQLVPEEIALKLAPVWVSKDKVLRKLLLTQIHPKWWVTDNNLAIKHSHFREACALSMYFGIPMPAIPDYLGDTLLNVKIQREA